MERVVESRGQKRGKTEEGRKKIRELAKRGGENE